MAPEEPSLQPTVSEEVDETGEDDGEWTDATSSEEEDDDEYLSPFADMSDDIRQVIELTEQNNALLQ